MSYHVLSYWPSTNALAIVKSCETSYGEWNAGDVIVQVS